MVRRRYVVVSIRLQAPDRVLLLKLEVIDEALQKLPLEGHLLKAREEAGLALLRQCFFVSCSHVWVVSNVGNANASLRIGVQDLLDEVLALRREELGHLVVRCHDLLVQVRCLGVLEWEVASHHGVEYDTAGPDIRLKTVISLASNHLRHSNEGSVSYWILKTKIKRNLPQEQRSKVNHKQS